MHKIYTIYSYIWPNWTKIFQFQQNQNFMCSNINVFFSKFSHQPNTA